MKIWLVETVHCNDDDGPYELKDVDRRVFTSIEDAYMYAIAYLRRHVEMEINDDDTIDIQYEKLAKEYRVRRYVDYCLQNIIMNDIFISKLMG